MAKTRRKYKGNATPATISAGLSAGATSATISSNTGWPTSGPFYCVVDPGTSAEEKILVGSISGTSLSSITRGVDDTSDQNHASGCTIYPVFTAIDADEANELTATYANQGGIVYQGASTFTQLAIGTAGQVMKVNSGATAPEWGQVATAGLADGAVNEDKLATGAVTTGKIANGAILNEDINASAAIDLSKLGTGALPTSITVASANIVTGTIVDEDIATTAAISLAKLATGALPTDITVASANIVNGTIIADDLASNSVTTAKITDSNVTNAKLDYTTVPQMTVSTSDPSGGKNGDIWVKVV